MEKEKLIFTYRVTSDTGFAPCVDDNLLTLACCKGGTETCERGLRRFIGSLWEYFKENPKEKTEIYVSGIYDKKYLLYLAKITDVIEMKEYFSNKKYKGRSDQIYKPEGDNLIHIEGIEAHNSPHLIKCDINGKYVLLSEEFVYLGDKSIEVDDNILSHYPKTRGQLPTGQHIYSPSDILTDDNKNKSEELYLMLWKLIKEKGYDLASGSVSKPHISIESNTGCGICGHNYKKKDKVCGDCGKE